MKRDKLSQQSSNFERHPIYIISPTRHDSTPLRLKQRSPGYTSMNTNIHDRLPSFQALTKEFPTLKIDENIPKPPPPPPYQGPNPPVSITHTQAHRMQKPVTPLSAFPPPRTVLQSSPDFHQQPQNHVPPPPFSYSHSQGYAQESTLQERVRDPHHYRFPCSPTNATPPHFQHPPHPFTPSGPSSSTAGPSSAIGPRDTNYVVTASPFPPRAEGDCINLPDPTSGRRLSMQFAPYPSHHTKNDSYDSQGSLSTLADIASTHDHELHKMIKDIEQSMAKYRQFSTVMHDMESKFRGEMERDNPNGSQQRVQLAYEYMDSHGRHVSDMDIERVKSFVTQIPVEQLRDLLTWAQELKGHFDSWLNYRSIRAGSGVYVPSTPSPKTKIIAAGPYIKYSHQRNDSFSGLRRRDVGDSGRVHKKKKSMSVSNRRKDTDVTLVVKPPTPVVTSVSATNQPTDIPNADLSRSTNHSCKQCDNDDTPEWRRGPYGSRSLCNACGLFYSKLCKKYNEKRAAEIMIERRDRGEGDDRRIPMD